jgi:hypothetical protein
VRGEFNKKTSELKDRTGQYYSIWVKNIREYLQRLTANAIVATILVFNPASSDTVETEGRQTKQC